VNDRARWSGASTGAPSTVTWMPRLSVAAST
jgi:hypothetical protein